jgi:hypothetical protein
MGLLITLEEKEAFMDSVGRRGGVVGQTQPEQCVICKTNKGKPSRNLKLFGSPRMAEIKKKSN